MMQCSGNQKGVTIYLAMLMMSSALATALFISSVFMREFRIARDVADSARAVYVADSAMEYTLYRARVVKDFGGFTAVGSDYSLAPTSCASSVVSDVAQAVCSVNVSPTASLGTLPGCPAVPLCNATDCMHIKSNGTYGTTNRALEIVFPNC